MSSDSTHSTVSYTSISYKEHDHRMYVSEPVYSKYLALSDDYILVEDQPLPAAASPAALSLGYVANSDPEEDPIDYAADADRRWERSPLRGGR
ncbi:hypothetical protein Tco_1408455 [Tanacetum coccineum]